MGSFLCLIKVGILSPSLLCATWVQLQWLRPLVAPVSSSAPGPGWLPCPDPCANYFQSSRDLYHTNTGASGTAAPPGSSFSGFSLCCLVGGDCYHGCEQHLDAREASGQLVGIGCFPDLGLFPCTYTWSQHSSLRNSKMLLIKESYEKNVTQDIWLVDRHLSV